MTKDSATGLKKLTFATSYSASSAAAYVAPSLGDITINRPSTTDVVCSSGSACDSANPVDITSDNGTWGITFTGAAPEGSFWQVILTDQSGQEFRLLPMNDSVTGSGIVKNTNGTYTITNNGLLLEDNRPMSITIRVTDKKGKDATIIGQTRSGQGAYIFFTPPV